MANFPPFSCPGDNCPDDPSRFACDEGSHTKGPYCKTCEDNYYLAPLEGRCDPCGDMSRASSTMLVKYAIAAAQVIILAYVVAKTIGMSGDAKAIKTSNKMTRLQAKLRSKWKICYVAFSIIYSMPDLLPSIRYPAVIEHVFHAFSTINFDLITPLPIACFLHTDHHAFKTKLVLATLGPFVVIVAAVVGSEAKRAARSACSSSRHAREAVEVEDDTVEPEPTAPACAERAKTAFISVALLVTYLVVPTVTTIIFRTFVCMRFDEETDGLLSSARLMVVDSTISCESPSYGALRAYALLMIVVWPLGIPLWYFCLLYRKRGRIDPEVDGAKARMKRDGGERLVGMALEIRDGDVTIQHLALLFGPYEGEFWYWEVIELLRRIAATSVVMIVSDGDTSRLFYCIILSIFSLNLYDVFEPFVSSSDDLLAEALQLITLLNFIATLGFEVGAGKFLGALMLALQVLGLLFGAALIYTDIHRERAALVYLAGEAKKHMKEYGVDLTHGISLGEMPQFSPKPVSKRASVSMATAAVAEGLSGLVRKSLTGFAAAASPDADDDDRSWDSAEDRDDFSEGSAGDIDALCTPRELSVVVSNKEEL